MSGALPAGPVVTARVVAAEASPTRVEPAALTVVGLDAGYGPLSVVRQAEMRVARGEVVALLGPNGAGKTTLLRALAGVVRPSAGRVEIGGRDVTRSRPAQRARGGLCLIPEGRGVFGNLTVEENLRLSSPPWIKKVATDAVFEAFPVLAERRKQAAGTMSGGQQQMLALSRAFLSDASVVLVDEVSMGLAPVMVDTIFEALQVLVARGKSVVLVEQYVQRALAMADTVYLMRKGVLTDVGAAAAVDQEELFAEYLGGVGDEQDRQAAPAADEASSANP